MNRKNNTMILHVGVFCGIGIFKPESGKPRKNPEKFGIIQHHDTDILQKHHTVLQRHDVSFKHIMILWKQSYII